MKKKKHPLIAAKLTNIATKRALYEKARKENYRLRKAAAQAEK